MMLFVKYLKDVIYVYIYIYLWRVERAFEKYGILYRPGWYEVVLFFLHLMVSMKESCFVEYYRHGLFCQLELAKMEFYEYAPV